MAGKLAFAASPAEAYGLAQRILDCRDEIEKERAQWLRWLEREPSDQDVPFWREQLQEVETLKQLFEEKLLADPAGAVRLYDEIENLLVDPTRAAANPRGAAAAGVARAVEHTTEWIRQRAGEQAIFLANPWGCLRTLRQDPDHQVRDEADLVALLEEPDVQEALQPSNIGTRRGPRVAATIIVAIVTGQSVSSVRRDSGSVYEKLEP